VRPLRRVGRSIFRPAPSGPVRRHVRDTALQIVVIWSLFLGAIPLALVRLERALPGATLEGVAWRLAPMPLWENVVQGAGAALFLVASALGLWSGLLFALRGDGTPLPTRCVNCLLILGPYRHVRNPMALAGISQGVGVGMMLNSPLVVAYSLAGALVWNCIARPLEEEDLESRFGEEFRRYQGDVRCWLPRLRPYEP
jgi:protein-S-isoprenylcysteine O-methyltransferase Ste14